MAKAFKGGYPLIIAAVVLVTLPLLNAMLRPKPGQPVTEIDHALHFTEPSRILAMAIGALGMAYVVVHFVRGGGVDLNLINFFILFLGILLLGTPQRLPQAAQRGNQDDLRHHPPVPVLRGHHGRLGPGRDHLRRLHQHLHP